MALSQACFQLFSVMVVAVLLAGNGAGQQTPADSEAGRSVSNLAPEVAATIAASANGRRPPQASDTRDFTIGPDDVLAINVWKEPEISRVVPVRSDGKISLPLVGDMEASGFTASQLQSELQAKLTAYIAEPVVSVIVQEIKSKTYNILGEVVRPGTYPLSRPTSVLDALATAGGFREWAKVGKMYVLRRGIDGKTRRIAFDYKRAIRGQEANTFELQTRDTIVVP